MTVYIDDMYLYPIGEFKRGPYTYKMSHLIADTTDELIAMVKAIGLNAKWIQYPGTHKEHFDITKTMRAKAIKAGAVEITYAQCGMMSYRRLVEGTLGLPEEIAQWREAENAKERAS